MLLRKLGRSKNNARTKEIKNIYSVGERHKLRGSSVAFEKRICRFGSAALGKGDVEYDWGLDITILWLNNVIESNKNFKGSDCGLLSNN